MKSITKMMKSGRWSNLTKQVPFTRKIKHQKRGNMKRSVVQLGEPMKVSLEWVAKIKMKEAWQGALMWPPM